MMRAAAAASTISTLCTLSRQQGLAKATAANSVRWLSTRGTMQSRTVSVSSALRQTPIISSSSSSLQPSIIQASSPSFTTPARLASSLVSWPPIKSSKSYCHQHSESPADTTIRWASKKAADPVKAAETKAKAFVVTVGYSPAIAKGVVQALKDSGLSGDSLLTVVKSMAGRWEVDEDEGLEALAASVKQSLALQEGKAMITFYVVPPNGWTASNEEEGLDKEDDQQHDADNDVDMSRAFPVRGLEGMSITDVAKFGTDDGGTTLGEYLECACAGIMACSTCHVIVDDAWFAKVGAPSEAELDMIDLAYNPQSTSRLGCQIILTKDLDGLVIKLPSGANNLMDFIPFE